MSICAKEPNKTKEKQKHIHFKLSEQMGKQEKLDTVEEENINEIRKDQKKFP